MAAEHVVRMGARIREERERAGLTQRELADLIPGKADGTQVSKWERGRNRPSDDTLEHIAKALNCDVAVFHVSAPVAETPDLMAALDAPGSLARLEARLTGIEEALRDLLAIQAERETEAADPPDAPPEHEDEEDGGASAQKP
jgi:transcriptional regulator with XRE-family HTH domain